MHVDHRWWSRGARRIRALLYGDQIDRELDEEIRLHVDLEAEELMRREHLAPDEARRRALVAFGGVTRYKEAHRDIRGWSWLEDLGKDVRYGLRGLLRAPAFSLSAVSILALGIGATATMFSAVNAVLLAHLPYAQSDELVRIYQQNSPTNRWAISTVDFQAVETLQRTFAAVGAISPRNMAVIAGGDPVQMPVGRVSSGLFRVLGVRMAAGRALTPDDDRVGAPPVLVLGRAMADHSLGGLEAVGRSVTIDGTAYTVVGVLPDSMIELAGVRSQLWPALQMPPPSRRGPFWLGLIARRAPGVSLDDARRDLAALSQQVFPAWSSGFQDSTARLTPYSLEHAVQGDAGTTLGIFSAAVLLVLLIAIANVVNLMLVRFTGRWREVVLRTTLGASRGRLIRMLVTESIVLTGAGGLSGILLGVLGLRLLGHIAPDLHGIAEARFGWSGAGFAGVVALLTGMAIAAYPVALVLRRERPATLRDGGRAVSAGKRTGTVRAMFVVAEFALALPLLAGAGLLLNSFLRLQRVNPGFDPTHMLTIAVRLPGARYQGDSAIAGYWATALPRIGEVAGVGSTGLGTALPPDDQNICCNNFDLVDRPVAPGGAQPTSPWADVDVGYFSALGIRLEEGRFLTPEDTAGAPPVAVVSRAWAQHYYPGEAAVGRQFVSGGCTTCPLTTIVGIVGNVKYQGLGGHAEAMYDPLAAGWPLAVNLFVRTNGPPRELIAGVRAALASVDPGVPLDDIAPMEDRLYASMADPRRLVALIGAFAGVALTLAAIGVFGMLSYTVNARRREIGVRMALGATQESVVGMIVSRGMLQAAIGIVLGLCLALAGTRALGSALYGVSASDPGTLAMVTTLLFGVAGVASWLAARRAAMVDPVEAIRAE
ncbi:MAG: ABC transporter permease [Gemmatimonadota bacterium]